MFFMAETKAHSSQERMTVHCRPHTNTHNRDIKYAKFTKPYIFGGNRNTQGKATKYREYMQTPLTHRRGRIQTPTLEVGEEQHSPFNAVTPPFSCV